MSSIEKDLSEQRRVFGVPIPDDPMASIRAAAKRIRRRSMVTRDPESVIWFRRAVLKHKPVLYRFEVQLVDHCNLDCRGCEHFAGLCRERFADLAEFETDMQHMANLFSRVRQIHLIGGEPLLHPKVLDFCKIARATFPESRIYLRTNGVLLMRQSEEFWSALAASKITLLVAPYPIGIPELEITLAAKQRHVKLEWVDLDEELVKVPIDPRTRYDAAASFQQCQGLKNRPLLRNGRLYPCAYIAFADVFREQFNLPGLQVYPTDWIGIRDEPDPEHVFKFLRNPVHWCSNCDMDQREYFPWGRSTRDISEWTRPPQAQRRL